MNRKRTYRNHDRMMTTSLCEDTPTCALCDTGMLCDATNDTHACGWVECVAYDAVAHQAWRTRSAASYAAARTR